MKQILTVLIALVTLASCTTSSSGERQPDPSKTKAKLKCMTVFTGESTLQYGDLVIRYIDTLYAVGDNVRLGAHEFQVISKP